MLPSGIELLGVGAIEYATDLRVVASAEIGFLEIYTRATRVVEVFGNLGGMVAELRIHEQVVQALRTVIDGASLARLLVNDILILTHLIDIGEEQLTWLALLVLELQEHVLELEQRVHERIWPLAQIRLSARLQINDGILAKVGAVAIVEDDDIVRLDGIEQSHDIWIELL